MTPKFAHYDGGVVIFTHHEAWWCDRFIGEWQEMRVTEAVGRAGVLTEEAFHREFGPLPPLPDRAFGGWFSPLT